MNFDRIDLSLEDFPKKWCNIIPDLPEPLPPYKIIESETEQRRLPEAYSKTASDLEFSDDRWIDIPEAVVEAYIHFGRPTPLIRARRLEEYLNTPAKIYYKCEDLPPGGTFKINTFLPQVYWAKKEGYQRTVFTGSFTTRTKFMYVLAARYFGLTPTLILPRGDCDSNPDQIFYLQKMLNADLVKSPSTRTEAGRTLLKEDPNHPGSSESVRAEVIEEVSQNKEAVSLIASFLNHALITQSIMGLEMEAQLNLVDESPNVIIGSVGSGSHMGGIVAPFMRAHLQKKLDDVTFLAVESETSAKLTKGTFAYFPMLRTSVSALDGWAIKIYKHEIEPLTPISAKGIHTKTTAPLLSFMRYLGLIDTQIYPGDEQVIFEAANIFLQTEGRLIAPESAYAVRAAIDQARDAKAKGEERVIVASVSGTAFLDFGEKERYVHSG